MDHGAITAALEAALMTDAEMASYAKHFRKRVPPWVEEAKAETEAQLVAWGASVEYLYEEAKAGCEKLVDGMDAAEATAVVAANATCKAKLAECRGVARLENQLGVQLR